MSFHVNGGAMRSTLTTRSTGHPPFRRLLALGLACAVPLAAFACSGGDDTTAAEPPAAPGTAGTAPAPNACRRGGDGEPSRCRSRGGRRRFPGGVTAPSTPTGRSPIWPRTADSRRCDSSLGATGGVYRVPPRTNSRCVHLAWSKPWATSRCSRPVRASWRELNLRSPSFVAPSMSTPSGRTRSGWVPYERQLLVDLDRP